MGKINSKLGENWQIPVKQIFIWSTVARKEFLLTGKVIASFWGGAFMLTVLTRLLFMLTVLTRLLFMLTVLAGLVFMLTVLARLVFMLTVLAGDRKSVV
jgi:hypothetical protein